MLSAAESDASFANTRAPARMGYLAFVLDAESRARLMRLFPLRFPDSKADHITLAYGVPEPEFLPQAPSCVAAIGYVADDSLEAFTVIYGGARQRPDGSLYHLTASVDHSKGRCSAESNILVRVGTVRPISPVTLSGAVHFRAFPSAAIATP
jgi:hypothetical protein